MTWIKQFWRKWLTYFKSLSFKKSDSSGGVLFFLNNNTVDFKVNSDDHVEIGKIMGFLAGRNDMDELLIRMLQMDCYKDRGNMTKFLSGFGNNYREEMVTPESAFMYMKERSIV